MRWLSCEMGGESFGICTYASFLYEPVIQMLLCECSSANDAVNGFHFVRFTHERPDGCPASNSAVMFVIGAERSVLSSMPVAFRYPSNMDGNWMFRVFSMATWRSVVFARRDCESPVSLVTSSG